MTDLSNYYQRDPRSRESAPSERFPDNHVKYSALLKPLEWIDRVHRLFGSRAFKTKKALLAEFDSAAPLDEYLGTAEELKEARMLVVSFCEGFDSNPYVSSIGRFLGKKLGLDILRNRRKVLQYYHLHREFIEARGKVKAPVIITGVPRSGTTLLQRLMSEDANTRSPYAFEMDIAIPPLTSDANPLEDARIRRSGAAATTLSRLAPGFVEKFAESHLWLATEMEEPFVYMLHHNGIFETNHATAGKAYIDDFFKIEGKRPVFRYERLFLTMLDAYRPASSHWTLKSPNYAPYFPMIFEEYPDARIVVTHRNPLIVLPSYCRLSESWCIAFDEDGSFDKHRFAQFQKVFIDKCLTVPLSYRKEHPEKEEQIFDCMYQELFSDPIAMVKRVYQKFGIEYTEEFEKRMRVYLENNRQGKYGRHKYSLEEYGFEGQSIYQEYEDYMEHYGFGIPDKMVRPVSFDFGLRGESGNGDPEGSGSI